MKDLMNQGLSYRVDGTAAIKVQPTQIYDLSSTAAHLERGYQATETFGKLFGNDSSIYRDLKTGNIRGIPIAGATLSNKLVSLFASIAFTAAIILIVNLL